MMMFETSKHVPKTEKRCCVFENKQEIPEIVRKSCSYHWMSRPYMPGGGGGGAVLDPCLGIGVPLRV